MRKNLIFKTAKHSIRRGEIRNIGFSKENFRPLFTKSLGIHTSIACVFHFDGTEIFSLETAKHLKRRDFGRKEDEEARAYFPYGKLSQRTFRPKEFFSGLCFLVSPRLMAGARKTVNRYSGSYRCTCCIFGQIMIAYNQLYKLKFVGM